MMEPILYYEQHYIFGITYNMITQCHHLSFYVVHTFDEKYYYGLHDEIKCYLSRLIHITYTKH